MDVSDRPLIGLTLPFPLYRDLHFGDSGADVRAVQEALSQIGVYDGADDGDFGSGTSAAITALYRRANALPPQPPVEAAAVLADLEVQVAMRDSARSTSPAGDTPAVPVDVSLDAQLAAARSAAGPWLPLHEVVMFPSSDMTVLSLQPVGTILDGEGPAISLRSDAARVTMRVSVADADTFVVGGAVVVSSLDGTKVTTTGTISSMSDFKDADDAESMPGYDAVIELADPTGFSDGSRVSISPEGAAETEAGLVVPLIAVREDGEGNYVFVRQPVSGDNEPVVRRVEVTPGLQADGYVIVTSSDLAVGQSVVVGAAG